MTGPDPRTRHPMEGFPQVAFLRNVITRPNIIVGDYTYYDDPDGVERFEQNVLYHFPFVGDKLIIGKFCALAKDVKFVMNGANHLMSGFSTYPFQIFGNGWERVMPPMDAFPRKGDTIVGNDVWIGYDSIDHARREHRRRCDRRDAVGRRERRAAVRDRRRQSGEGHPAPVLRRDGRGAPRDRVVELERRQDLAKPRAHHGSGSRLPAFRGVTGWIAT